MRYVLTADQEDLRGTESASLSTAAMLSHILAVDLDRDHADDEDPEELFMGLFPRWTVRASIDPSDPHYLDGDDDRGLRNLALMSGPLSPKSHHQGG